MGSCLSSPSPSASASEQYPPKVISIGGPTTIATTSTIPESTHLESSNSSDSLDRGTGAAACPAEAPNRAPTKRRPSWRESASKLISRYEKVAEWKKKLRENGDLAQAVVHIETSETKRIEDVYAGVHSGPVLSTGAEGTVRKCIHRETGVEFAVKCLNVGLIESDETLSKLREEILIMCKSDHPRIIRLEGVYQSDSQIYLVQNLLTGGDMFDRLEEQPDYRYDEVQCAKIVKQMMNAVRYLHSKKIVHRDLKLENFLFEDPHSDNIRLIDFGLSKHFDHDGHKHQEAVGTPYMTAPEMIKGEYDEKVDVWAMGVITYLLLSGDPPFGGMDGESLSAVTKNILECNVVFEPREVWDNVSAAAKNFVKRLLTADPSKRPSAQEAQRDEWLSVYSKRGDSAQGAPLNPKLVGNLLQFKDYSNLQKILLEVVSFTLVPEQIKDLKQDFEKIDRDGRGEIALGDLKEVLLNHANTGALGALTEEEVETVFNSLRLEKSGTTIRWHQFIAAGLSKADYDNRNLRLAFNRLDRCGKGFITLTDLNDMLSANDDTMDQEIMYMWQDGIKEFKCKDKLSFEDFRQFLKGQAPRNSLVGGLQTAGSLRRFSLTSHGFTSSGEFSVGTMTSRHSSIRDISGKTNGSLMCSGEFSVGTVTSRRSLVTSSRILASTLSLRDTNGTRS